MKNIIDDVVRAGFVISKGLDIKMFISSLVDQLFDITGSDLSCFYSVTEENIKLLYRRGKYIIPENISIYDELIQFELESFETVVLTERKKSPFISLLLHESMNSGVLSPVATKKKIYGLLFLNSKNKLFFNRSKLRAIESITKLAGEYFHNTILHNKLKDYTKRIETLERYQKNIFSSMTNLLITTDTSGNLKYFNRMASERFLLTKDDINKNITTFFSQKLSKKMLSYISSSIEDGKEIVGAEGIYKDNNAEIDFALNASPLTSKRGKREGLTLLFSDQSRERKLEKEVHRIREDRRIIKDMFSRYLSEDIVSRLVENPNLIHLGGDKKEATIFFADIRGYTSFSEGRDPEYIIHVLNEYFKVAVDIIIKYKGYIDKFIGDCIMAAWGVPLKTEEEDAKLSVSCALEIMKAINNKGRNFFKGEASNLKIGIGINSGPLVAGNLGSEQRTDYTVIGDTVNIASRLEGIAGPEEIIITESTKSLIGNSWKLKGKGEVKVKGKLEPIKIYKVLRKVG